ncbi:DNA primase [Leptospira yasudae]|uniref:DNA primase n=1 Tax=Leptospira yasudae TaxID=2202201 RepID=A0A6N4R3M9_9LEPT|nr:DNA primase [Leptospira yasudae]TGL82270.1 DNA primase [Leptospira yasudae]TGL84458.1 DNA primase [Leptospira yasudae]TGL89059.1 DNA primase [Leptospira yasudae]
MSNKKDFIDRVHREVPIESYISRFVPLKKRGKNFLGLCPFHQEKSPSFNVSAEKQFYYCFGCKASGDLIRFVMDYERVDFSRSLEILSEYSGIPLEEKNAKVAEISDFLYKINQRVSEYYQHLLHTPIGKNALDYLKSREIEDSEIRLFGLGYAPEGFETLAKEVLKTKDEIAGAIQLGLLREKEAGNNRPYDFFRDRIMFPVLDLSGRTIAFSGRILGPGKEAKYINSPASVIFDKSRTFYNFFRAREGVRKTGEAMLVEGYLDVIGLVRRGYENVVASMGTAITENHIRTMKKFAEKVTFVLDGDIAGKKGALRAAEICLKEGMECSIVLLPEGKDPFDLAKSMSRPELGELLSEQIQGSEFVVEELLENATSKTSPEKKRRSLQNLYAFIQTLNRETDKQFLLGMGANKLGISMDAVLRDFKGGTPKNGPANADTRSNLKEVQEIAGPALDCERKIISMLVKHTGLFSYSEEISSMEFMDTASSFLWDYLYTIYTGEGDISPVQILSSELPEDLKRALAPYLMEEDSEKVEPGELHKVFRILLLQQKKFRIEERIRELDQRRERFFTPEIFTELSFYRKEKEKILEHIRSQSATT